jgi:hypothetical protein
MSLAISPNYISPFIDKQIPEFYQTYGPLFVEFLKCYYVWLEQPDNFIGKSRQFSKIWNIDTGDLFHLINSIFPYLPLNIQSNPRLFLKHIYDLYNSKGTEESFILLFKALYNKDVKLYAPNKDILKISDGNWVQPQYVEIYNNKAVFDPGIFVGNKIIGYSSNTTAIVESFETKIFQGKSIDVLYISNLIGNFIRDETIGVFGQIYNDLVDLPKVLGSLNAIHIVSSTGGFNIGDICNMNGNGFSALSEVTSIGIQNGAVKFSIINGGYGYTTNAQITVSGGTGINANFKIGGIRNVSYITVNTDYVNPYLSVYLAANNYGFPLYTSLVGANSNINTPLYQLLATEDLQIGTIDYLTNINPGSGYSIPPNVQVTEPLIADLYMLDSTGKVIGNDAIIIANSYVSNSILTGISIIDSGFAYQPGEFIEIINQSNSQATAYGFAVVYNEGTGSGYWTNNNGMLDADKYIQDSYYYQTYSYEVQTDIPETTFETVVNDTVHLVGLERFYKFRMIDDNNNTFNSKIIYPGVVQKSENGNSTSFGNGNSQ